MARAVVVKNCDFAVALPVRPKHEADGGITYEVDPDFLEHVRREECRQGELPWDD